MEIRLLTPRKLQDWGHSKLLCIPHEWIRAHGLDKGDRILCDVDEQGRLILTPEARGEDATS